MEDYKDILGLNDADSPEIMADKFVIYIGDNLSKFVEKTDEEYPENKEELEDDDKDKFKNFELKSDKIKDFLGYFLDYLKTTLNKDNKDIDLFINELIKISNIKFPKPEEEQNN